MDPRTLLDHALFQLTPTRTRCDLVIFAGGENEKLASGLLEPFVSHLKTAKDQISKGGYSIILRSVPPRASWFTKATLQRFVRFVGTPEVLERVVMIEKEIDQIGSSVLSNEQSNAEAESASANYKRSNASSSDAGQEENPKVHLQRALETRKAMLHKEQAMAYARALVTGFDIDGINDLISFADAFGASRLREACINFMELCKKKNQDRLWMDEIAALQASRLDLPYLGTSGITLSEEYHSQIIGKLNGVLDASVSETASQASLDLSQEGKAQVPVTWPNHLPQHMQSFQGPMFQQMPPYQGYVFPGMQAPSPYFPGNMQWSSKTDDSSFGHDVEFEDHRKYKSSRKKKSSHGKGYEISNSDESTETSDSSLETESDQGSRKAKMRRKKNGKKSSRKFVIRNINYITSMRDGEKGTGSEGTSDEEDFIDGKDLKKQVKEAVGSLERKHKSSSRQGKESRNGGANNLEGEKAKDQWGAFQSLLMKDNDENSFEPHPIQEKEEYFVQEQRSLDFNLETDKLRKPHPILDDSFVATKSRSNNEGEPHIQTFETGENVYTMTKKRESTDEQLLLSSRTEASGKYSHSTISDYSSESLIIKSQKGDLFMGSQLGNQANKNGSMDLNMFEGDYASSINFHGERNKKDFIADDSFMIQSQAFGDDQSDSQLRTDISMVPELVEASRNVNGTPENENNKVEAVGGCEPDDLYMVIGHDSATENGVSSWMPETDYGDDILSAEVNGWQSSVELNVSEDKFASDNKKTNGKTSVNSGKNLSGKEARSRVLGRSLPKSKPDVMSRTKQPSSAGRSTVLKIKAAKEEESKRRMEELLIQRQKRIAERSSGGKSSAQPKKIPVQKAATANPIKPEQPKTLHPSQDTKKPVFKSSTMDRLATARTSPKVAPAQSNPVQPKKPVSKANGVSQKHAGSDNKNTVKSNVHQKNNDIAVIAEKPMQSGNEQQTQLTDNIDDVKHIKNSHSFASAGENEGGSISAQKEILDDDSQNGDSPHIHTFTLSEYSKNDDVGLTKVDDHVLSEARKSSADHREYISQTVIHSLKESPNNAPDHVSAGSKRENNPVHVTFHPSINSEIEISSLPPTQTETEPTHSRKKWNNDDHSPKALKGGFRKLFMFGRKSRNSAIS